MSYNWYLAARELFVPPTALILAQVACLLLFPFRPRLAGVLIATATMTLLLLAVPAVGISLLSVLIVNQDDMQPHGRTPLCGAVVVLGGGLDARTDRLAHQSQERVRAGALLSRNTGIPLLVSGGRPGGTGPAEAAAMARFAKVYFDVEARWIEDQSRNTRENAAYSHRLLSKAGISSICLVTDSLHMRRARGSFEAIGFTVFGAPVAYPLPEIKRPQDFLPTLYGLTFSRRAVLECLGLLGYWLVGAG